IFKFKRKYTIEQLLFFLFISLYTYANEANIPVYNTNYQEVEKVITGKVTSTEGESLPGVNIYTEDQSIGTITNINGEYILTLPKETEILVFSYVGYITEHIDISDLSNVDVILIPDFLNLSEIVVIGYGQVQKSDLTGSVVSISQKDFEQQSITRMDQILQGRTSGVSVINNSGAPGADVKIRIRGANSIVGDNNPLIIVDGVSGMGLGDINTNDIESIEVLKDASSTAIYGSRGSNGVILVTTRSGEKEQKARFSFDAFNSISELPKSMNYLNAYEFATLYNTYNVENGNSSVFDEEQLEDFRINGGTDWEDEIFRKGNTQSYTLSFYGGSKKTSYYVSADYLNQDGIVINSNYKRYAFRAKIESDLSDMFRIGANIAGNRQLLHNTENVGDMHSTIGRLPMWVSSEPVWQEGSDGETYNNLPEHGAGTGNPVGLQMLRNTDKKYNNALISGFVNVIPFTDFNVNASINVQINDATDYFLYNTIPMPGTGIPYTSISNSLGTRIQSNLVATYKKEIGMHKIQLTGVFENMSYKQDGNGVYVDSLSNIGYQYYALELNERSKQHVSSYYQDEKLRSYAGRLNYVLAGKYLFTATIRGDGSSKFKDENKWGYFPSAALGWNLSKEKFIENLGVFSNLKLRLSWGITGSQAVSPYATLTRFTTDDDTHYAIDGPEEGAYTGISVGTPGNEYLKWETTTEKNLGLEMAFFRGRLSFEGDCYHKLTSDLLLPYALPAYSGSYEIIKNTGKVENKGFDVLISGIAVDKPNFYWKTDLNFSVNRNKVVSLGDEERYFPTTSYSDNGTIFIVMENEPMGTFYGFKYEGVWSVEDSINNTIPAGYHPGYAKVTDTMQIIGSAEPKFTYGINNTIKLYKNFEINIFFQGVQGGQIYNMQKQNSFGLNGQARAFTAREWYDRWTSENQDSDIPSFTSSENKNVFSSRWLEDASYLRLKNISIGYYLPDKILKFAKISSFKVYFSAQNLFTITKYTGYDPEASTARNASDGRGSSTDTDQNIDSGAYPNPRTYNIGIKISF
ncbi:MAG: TonB-dependent receptor, partial [Bacteroidales bacterium]|nr:TonB-dependent receptor [Bacteroidales bacterium]